MKKKKSIWISSSSSQSIMHILHLSHELDEVIEKRRTTTLSFVAATKFDDL